MASIMGGRLKKCRVTSNHEHECQRDLLLLWCTVNGGSSELVKHDGCTSEISVFPSGSAAGEIGWAWGYLDLTISRTDFHMAQRSSV